MPKSDLPRGFIMTPLGVSRIFYLLRLARVKLNNRVPGCCDYPYICVIFPPLCGLFILTQLQCRSYMQCLVATKHQPDLRKEVMVFLFI